MLYNTYKYSTLFYELRFLNNTNNQNNRWDCGCISFIRTLGTHNKHIIKLHHVTHTHSISADISLIVKSRSEIALFRTRSNSFTNCASRVTSTVLHGWCIACLYTWQKITFLTWISYLFRRMAIFIPIGDWANAIAFVIITLTISLSLVNNESTNLQKRFTSTIDTWHESIIGPTKAVCVL